MKVRQSTQMLGLQILVMIINNGDEMDGFDKKDCVDKKDGVEKDGVGVGDK